MLFNLSRSWIVSFPPLDGLNKEQTRDYSDHDFQVLVVHRQFLTTKQMDTNGALVRAGLKLMMIHQSVSPNIKYTSLILFEVIVEADVWIFRKTLGLLINFGDDFCCFFQRLENIMQFCEEKPQEPMQDVYIHI